jgi:glycogen phosphorylase
VAEQTSSSTIIAATPDRVMAVIADFDSYLDAQARVDTAYRSQTLWTRKAILNVARCGYFSSDRSVGEYAEKIWKLRG